MPKTKVLTNKDILLSQGLIEIVNPDGSRSQMTLEQAEAHKKALKNLNEAIEEAKK